MKKTIQVLLALSITIAFVKCGSEKEQPVQTVWPGYQPFPSGYGYMDTTQLQAAYNQGNIGAIREHAWSLFAGIMQPASNNSTNSWPLWYTWPNSVWAMQIQQLDTENVSPGLLSSLIRINKSHSGPFANLPAPYYPVPPQVLKAFAGQGVFFNSDTAIVPGKHFMSNGNILIPTESISLEGYNWIQGEKFYDQSVMDSLSTVTPRIKTLEAPSTYVVTKHMFWPVLANQFSAIPVWDTTYFSDTTTKYVGYEMWKRIIAVDPSNTMGGQKTSVSYLYNVFENDKKTPLGPFTNDTATIHNINEFYYHQITQADWDSMDKYDKACLMASSYWAYNKPIGVNDYLVTIAMHINTKELYTWTMQSAWWTDQPNVGSYSFNRPDLSSVTKDTTWKHYDMVDAYGIPVSGAGQLPVATNPYIELVSHPYQTNCNNCHMRAGYPSLQNFPEGASYQNSGCPDLLMKLTGDTSCLTKYMRTDFQWIITDYTHAIPPKKK